MQIYCQSCKKDIIAKLVSGREIYPNNHSHYNAAFWQCPTCRCFIECFTQVGSRAIPINNNIPSSEIRKAKEHISDLCLKLCDVNKLNKDVLLNTLHDKLGYKYNPNELLEIEEARRIYKIILSIGKELT
jgi:hypothetical protein